MPLFSIIIPSYNRASSIIKSIQAVLKQSNSDWEILLVDDGSDDNTKEIVNDFLTESRIKYLYQNNRGVSSARNLGAKNASGKYLIFFDSDDDVEIDWLSDFNSIFYQKANVDIIQCGYKRHDLLSGNVSSHPALVGKYNVALAGTFVIRSDIFQSVGGYDEKLKYSENMELFLRISQLNFKTEIIEGCNLIYNDSGSGGSRNLSNLENSLSMIIAKHNATLSRLDKWNFNQTLGVVLLRLENYSAARSVFIKAISNKPLKFKTYLRLFIAYFPVISRMIYKRDNFVVSE